MEIFTFVVSLILILLPFADWTASYILHRASKRADHTNIALRERARIAIVLAITTSINSIFAYINLFNFVVPPVFLTVALSISFVLVGVPNLYWLSLYYSNRLRK